MEESSEIFCTSNANEREEVTEQSSKEEAKEIINGNLPKLGMEMKRTPEEVYLEIN